MFSPVEVYPIRDIGHVALQVPDLDSAVDHAESIIGLRESERTDSNAYMTCGGSHHCVQYLGVGTPALDHVGLLARGQEAVELICDRLDKEGVRWWEASGPGIESAIRFEGPEGHVFEVYPEMRAEEPAWYQTCGMRPLRFGHVTLKAEDVGSTESFLGRMLGYRVSDRIEGGLGTWLRTGELHHSLAIMKGGCGFHHYAFEVANFGELERLGDLLFATGQRFIYGPGRHGIGNNLFTYHRDTSGLIVEFGCEFERIELMAPHEPGSWPDNPDMENVWGPQPQEPNFNEQWTPLISLGDRSSSV